MAWVKIDSYYLRYDIRQSQCIVGIHFMPPGVKTGKPISQQFSVSAFDAAFLADMLRNEAPVYYEPELGAIATGKEEVGEGEGG